MARIVVAFATSICLSISLRKGFMVPTVSSELHLAHKTEAWDK